MDALQIFGQLRGFVVGALLLGAEGGENAEFVGFAVRTGAVVGEAVTSDTGRVVIITDGVLVGTDVSLLIVGELVAGLTVGEPVAGLELGAPVADVI
eukprot:CAMPEP_0118694270 /NCGR_PEP_ID=MMETSP0800-20121206/12407_1 /TAXON_ID=210618 ORGANISM="Striatella unipunctata, Strain CCMP2910" /NCGR_SAMPLE_ID=MMETSP0800 /ASSEMBLY_ACC=CAM_ASM_000638 /LENGTH=96 /DNA_ID=CAMNT_0006592671 /DNA_START=134 /DNA_END=422 /DNA_ORIENTATION=-